MKKILLMMRGVDYETRNPKYYCKKSKNPKDI